MWKKQNERIPEKRFGRLPVSVLAAVVLVCSVPVGVLAAEDTEAPVITMEIETQESETVIDDPVADAAGSVVEEETAEETMPAVDAGGTNSVQDIVVQTPAKDETNIAVESAPAKTETDVTVKSMPSLKNSIGSSTTPEQTEDQTSRKNGIFQENDGYYYYLDDVKQTKVGKLTWNGDIYYIENGGKARINAWWKDGNDWRYLGSDGKAVKNQWKQDSTKTWYYLNKNAVMAKNEFAKDTYGFRWVGSDAKIVSSKWIQTNGEWYYLKGNGYRAANEWAADSVGWWYMGPDGKCVKNQWILWKGSWYWMKASGYMASNEWIKDGNDWYFLKSGGKMASRQWIQWKGWWYYLKSGGKMASNEWAADSIGWCWTTDSGRCAHSKWIWWNGYWYYLKSDGYMAASEWVKDSVGPCWVNASGKFTERGTSSSNVQGYYSSTSYLITVDRSEHVVSIYRGSKWNWTLVDCFSCGNGKASTPTVSGEFSIPEKYPRSHPYFDSGSARCWYPTRITGGYLFHSVLYYQTGSPSSVMDGRLGVGVSHGCVRLALDKAKWIYDNIPIGTKVVIW